MNNNYIISVLEDDYSGIKKIYHLNDKLVAYIVPRFKVSVFSDYSASHKAGVYILFNNEQKKIYIGQTGIDSRSRLYQHGRNFDFWNTAIVFTTEGQDLTPTHAKIIESLLIARANELGLEMLNRVDSNQPEVQDIDQQASREWENQIVRIIKALNLCFFNSEICESRNNRRHSQNEIVKPVAYEINKKTYNFQTWTQMMVDLCERIIEIEGFETFKHKVMSSADLTRKRFKKDGERLLSYAPYCHIQDLWLCKHGSAIELNNDIETILELFPGINKRNISN